MPDDAASLFFTPTAQAAGAPPKKRTFSDAEVSAPAAAAPAAPTARRTYSDAEVSAPQQVASPQLKQTMSTLFAPEQPQPLPAYDPNTGKPMAPGAGLLVAPTEAVENVNAGIRSKGVGPTIAAAAQLPITDPTAMERLFAHGERGFENTVAGQARGNVQQGDLERRQADALDIIIANSEKQGSNVATRLDPSMTIPTKTDLPLVDGINQTYVSTVQPKADPLTGIVSQAASDPNVEATQTLGYDFAGKPLDELKSERNRLRALSDQQHADWLARERQVAGQFETMTPAHDIAGRAAAVVGEVGGGMLSPENYIGAGRGATLIRTVGREAFVNGVVGMLVDPIVQRSQVSSGAREQYDPTQTLMAGATSAAGGALLPFAGAGFKRLTGVAKNWLARRRRVTPDQIDVTTMTPQEQSDFARSPDVQAFIDAHADQLTTQQVDVLTKRLEQRRAAEADPVEKARQAAAAPERVAAAEQGPVEGGATVPPEQRRGPAAKQGRAQEAEVEAIRKEIAGVDEGQIAPGAANLPRAREPLPGVITPERYAAEERLPLATELRSGDYKLPAVIEPQPTRLTPEQIAHQARAMEATGGAGMRPDEGQGAPAIEAGAARMAAPTGRQPMTPTDIQGQREAGGAFALAERQRQRAVETPGAVDVSPAGRTMGAAPERVILDQGFPVRIVRQQGKNSIVRRYDPRTGRDVEGSIDYVVPTRNLESGSYAKEPRLAQDVQQRVRGPRPPEEPRFPQEGVSREQRQTYRMTPPDVGEPPHVGRSPFPEQPGGPHPGRPRPTFEDVMRRFHEQMRAQAEARARAQRERYRYQGSEQEQAQARARQRYEGKRSTNTPQARGKDGRYQVDEDGYVMSTGGGPIIFGDQKQAARWIVKAQQVGDQRFEIVNHPKGEGFSVREFTRYQEPPSGGPQEPPPGDQGPQGGPEGQAPPGGPETPPEAPAAAARGLPGPEAPEPAARTAPPSEPAAEPAPEHRPAPAPEPPPTQERVTPVEEPVAQERATEQPAPEVATVTPREPAWAEQALRGNIADIPDDGLHRAWGYVYQEIGDLRAQSPQPLDEINRLRPRLRELATEIENRGSDNPLPDAERAPTLGEPTPTERVAAEIKRQEEDQAKRAAESRAAEKKATRKAKAKKPPQPEAQGPTPEVQPKPTEAPDTRTPIEGVKGLDLNEARDKVRNLVDAYWNRETKYTDAHFDEMIGRAREQIADAEKELERTKGEGMNQHRFAMQEKARKARIDIAAYEHLKKNGYPEQPTLRQGYHAVEDLDKATARDVIEVGANRVRAGDWQGTGNMIARKGFDKAFDEAHAKSKVPMVEGGKAEAMRDFISKANKNATKEFKPIFAHQPEGDKTSPVVYGKVGDKVAAMNGRFYDYFVNQHGLDVKADKDGSIFAFHKDGKPVAFAAGFRGEPSIIKNIDQIAKEFETPLRGEEAVKYRTAKRPAPEARRTAPRVGAEPYRPTTFEKIAAEKHQKAFVAPLEEARSEAQARRLAELNKRQAEAPGGDYKAILEREQPFRDYNNQIDMAIKNEQARVAERMVGGSHMEPSVARGFSDGVHGITRKSQLGPSYDSARRVGVEWAKKHPAPEGYAESGYAPERGMIEATLKTARGRETQMTIPNTLEAIEGVLERTSGSKNLSAFYSNPFFDPAVWRLLVEPIGPAARATASGLVKLGKGIAHYTRKGGEQARPVVAMGSVLHSLRAKYPEIKALQEHADMLATDPGSGRHQVENFSEAVERSSNAFANKVEAAIDEAFGPNSTPEQREVLGDLLARRKPSGPVTPAIRKAFGTLRHLLDVRHFDAKKADAEIGYTPGYLPRMLDTHAVGEDREGFIKAAAYLFKRMGYNDPLVAAETLHTQAIFGDDTEFARPGLGFGQRHERARVFPKEADELLRKYLLKDPLELLQRYGIASARRIEGARRFGADGEKMLERYREMSRKGMSTEDFETVKRMTQGILGHGAYSAENTASGHLASFMHMIGSMALLPNAVASSLAEPFTAGMVRGNALDGFRVIANQIAQLGGTVKQKEAQDFAQAIGIVARGGMEQVMHNRFGDQFFKRWQRRQLERYFRRTLLHKLTVSQRKAATITGRAQLWQFAKDAAEGSEWAKSQLRELGIDDASQAKFSKFVADHGGFVDVHQMLAGGEMGQKYGQAVARIVDHTIQNPKKYDRPEAALSQRAIFALTSFNYAYYRNVQRAGIRKGFNNPMRIPSLMAAYATAAGAAMAVGYGRDALLNPTSWEQRPDEDKAMLLASRANLFGPLDPIVNAIFGLKYERSLSDLAVGAYPGLITGMLESVVKAYNDQAKTNTKDRQMARAVYGGLALPLIELALNSIPAGKFGKLGEAAISTGMIGAGAPYLKGKIVDLFAGEKQVHKKATHGFRESASGGSGFRGDGGTGFR